jgi:hypothetical protein
VEKTLINRSKDAVDAEIPFDWILDRWILDRVTGRDSEVTDYILEQPAKCPSCRWQILEKTPVEPGITDR